MKYTLRSEVAKHADKTQNGTSHARTKNIITFGLSYNF